MAISRGGQVSGFSVLRVRAGYGGAAVLIDDTTVGRLSEIKALLDFMNSASLEMVAFPVGHGRMSRFAHRASIVFTVDDGISKFMAKLSDSTSKRTILYTHPALQAGSKIVKSLV